MTLAEELDRARAEVARLERLAKSATCVQLGRHDWKSIGGANCGCHKDSACSVPVHECTRCGDSDYGDNDEARQMRQVCAGARAERLEYVIAAYELGELGHVEFTDLALEAGADLARIEKVLQDNSEDATPL